MADKSKQKRAILQLSRLERLTDVLFAIVIWNFFVLIPDPAGDWPWDSVPSFLLENWLILLFVLIGILISILFWLQNNSVLGVLERTDGYHTGFMIFQLFFLLIFLYTMHLGIVKGGSTGTRAFESCAVILMGATSALGWFYAIKNRRLVMPDVTDKEINDRTNIVIADLVTPLITLPFAFIGAIWWEVSWLLIIPLNIFIKRVRRPKSS